MYGNTTLGERILLTEDKWWFRPITYPELLKESLFHPEIWVWLKEGKYIFPARVSQLIKRFTDEEIGISYSTGYSSYYRRVTPATDLGLFRIIQHPESEHFLQVRHDLKLVVDRDERVA